MSRPTPTQREGWGLEGMRRGREREREKEKGNEFIIVDGGGGGGEEWAKNWGEQWNEKGNEWGENWNDGGKEWGKEEKEGGERQWREMILLVVLYTVQGLPLGLTFGSIPLLLRSSSSYSEIGIFSLAGYPYCMKLLWSPIVDAAYSSKIGRRRTWVIPLQLLLAVTLYMTSFYVEENIEQKKPPNIYTLTAIFFFLVMLAATQDIAVDGWALTLLSHKNQSAASMCQTIGLNIGFFSSFTLFLAFSSPTFCSTYLSLSSPLLSLSFYLRLCVCVYVLVTVVVVVFGEGGGGEGGKGEEGMTVGGVYKQVFEIFFLPSIRTLIVVLLTCKIAFIAHDSVTSLKLVDKGFGEANMGLFAVIEFPAQILFAFQTERWCRGDKPLNPWFTGYIIRLVACSLSPLAVYFYPVEEEVSPAHSYFYILLFVHLVNAFGQTMMFVSHGAFFARISDVSIGGTYLTLLNTLSNFGGTWPKFFVLFLVDFLSVSECRKGDEVLNILCDTKDNSSCTAAGGECIIIQDGYYWCGIGCCLVGIILMWYFKQTIQHLQKLSPGSWSIFPQKQV